MENLSQITIVFAIYALIILIIAYVSKNITKNLADYILAGRRLNAPLTALGAGASDMSSWLTMALPGFIYIHGLSMIWMPIALIIGAWSNWKFIAARLRIYTEISQNALTLPSYFYYRFQDHNKLLRLITGSASVIFFTCYAAAGFMSGAIVLQIIFNLNYINALLISSGIIILYTAVGGFLAVNWIDFFQGMLMFFALLIVPIITVNNMGGYERSLNILNTFFSQHLHLLKNVDLLTIFSCIAWGLGYFGQPHINVRFMAIQSAKDLPIARRICMGWMFLSLLGAIATGLFGAAFYSSKHLLLPETIFINLAKDLFNPWMTGILLSAVIASIMSTVSGQILITTSIIVEDLCPEWKNIINSKKQLLLSKLIMVAISIIAILIAINPSTILHAVGFAWSGLGAAFGPVIIFSLYWRNMNLPAAIAGELVGALSVILIQTFAKQYNLLPGFVLLPGFILSSIAIVVVGNFTATPNKKITDQFDSMLAKIRD